MNCCASEQEDAVSPGSECLGKMKNHRMAVLATVLIAAASQAVGGRRAASTAI
jgi:hypothetical protein